MSFDLQKPRHLHRQAGARSQVLTSARAIRLLCSHRRRSRAGGGLATTSETLLTVKVEADNGAARAGGLALLKLAESRMARTPTQARLCFMEHLLETRSE